MTSLYNDTISCISIYVYCASLYQAAQKLSPKLYRPTWQSLDTQITLSPPEPKEHSSLPRLKLIQGGGD